jgi:hypothetical protein
MKDRRGVIVIFIKHQKRVSFLSAKGLKSTLRVRFSKGPTEFHAAEATILTGIECKVCVPANSLTGAPVGDKLIWDKIRVSTYSGIMPLCTVECL